MPTRKLSYVQTVCVALCFAIASAIATNAQSEPSLATRIESALRAKEPDWKYIPTIENVPPPIVRESRIVTGMWRGPKSRPQDVIVSVYGVESREEAAKWLRPVRDKQVAVGWRVSAFEIGDEGYLSKYKNGQDSQLSSAEGQSSRRLQGIT